MADYAISREQNLFCDCVLLTPAERAQWLEDVCGSDLELRQRIERLIAAHESAEQATVEEPWAEAVPEFIDGYRIIRAVGEGGMGIVYEAQQEQPVRRRVAIKAVKPGMDSRQVIARFHMERQALAAMDHPYVAKVFDAGHMPSGRPYFVMEFVDGVPLLQYCDTNSFSIRQRIELFISICQAVQHAHHKGVIHRDLKPGNVLVTSEFDTPMPKIIDFGIARAVSPDERADMTQTVAGLRIGTPAYMSPEQAGRAGLDVDTRTDVYSLGVILYELLTGVLPADPGEGSVSDFLPRLANGELKAERPSTRKPLASDLDWIVLKAIEADRDRRYETPIALAEDLQRHLEGRPVVARPPTLAYRARKFIRRNRVSVVAATLAMIAILSGVTAGAVGLVRARRAEAAAKQDAEAAKRVSDFLVRLFSIPDPNLEPGAPVTVKHVLEEGTRRAQTELTNLPDTQARLLGTLSHVHLSMGSYREAKTLAEKALSLRPGI
jgi:eukaryotic-like serine/threonine-protein kinase